MIIIKSPREIDLMRISGEIAAEALILGGSAVKPGVTTKELNDIMHNFIKSKQAKPSFLGYGGFPACACISVNETVIHGIPNNRIIVDGDIVSIDIGVLLDGYHADTAATFGAGKISDEAQKLIDTTKVCLERGIAQALNNNRVGDIGSAVQEYAEKNGFSVVRDFVGHGVGTQLHEEPSIPNYGKRSRGSRLTTGMTIAIEPMINAGSFEIKTEKDGWTINTVDKKLSAHFEHTIVITDNEPLILTSL